jgi:hypothetical protein
MRVAVHWQGEGGRIIVRVNSLRTDGDFCRGRDTELRNCPKHLRLLKHSDMTIHWKGLEAHFLMALVFQFNHFQ